MSSKQTWSARDKKLNYVFNSFLHGDRLLENSHDAAHFLEAACLVCSNKGPSTAIESLVASGSGISALRLAVRFDLQPTFIQESVLPFLKHVANSSVKAVGNGYFLAAILDAILDPPTFWSALLRAHRDGELLKESASALHTFTWLCFEIVSSQSDSFATHRSDIQDIMKGPSLLKAPSAEVRVLAQRIAKTIALRGQGTRVPDDHGPGGRHDNDFFDFRRIQIFPSNDEMLSKEKPFLPLVGEVIDKPKDARARAYLDWMFRLLREDMLAELIEDLQAATGETKRKRRSVQLGDLSLAGSEVENTQRTSRPFVLDLRCGRGFEFLKMSHAKREEVFLDPKAIFKHKSLAALCDGTSVIAFGTMLRDQDALRKGCFGYQVTDSAGLRNAVTALLGPQRESITLHVVDTPTFAYEPILGRLQTLTELTLEDLLLNPQESGSELEQPESMVRLIKAFQSSLDAGLNVRPGFYPETELEGAQLQSAINGLRNPLALIQGPPGTGKSFIGALIVRAILSETSWRVLVLSYTNHALDQFLEDLLDICVKSNDIVRLGSKSTLRTQSMRVEELLKMGDFRLESHVRLKIVSLKAEAAGVGRRLAYLGRKLVLGKPSVDAILDHLEFSHSSFWSAFQPPPLDESDGFQLMLKGNKPASPQLLYKSWVDGMGMPGLGHLGKFMTTDCRAVWCIPRQERLRLDNYWNSKVRDEWIDSFVELSEEAKVIQCQLDGLFAERKRELLRAKRLIGCTTTGASMYQSLIETAEPEVVIVEEAGEILEAHVVAALGPSVKQLILIGDHKQLRPKVNNYALTVEKGDGYDLNVSLFERLIKQGHPFTTLREQHRSHPDISHFSRQLAYPNLKDHSKTLNRPAIRGLAGRVIFVHHEQPEEEMVDSIDRREPGSKSKRNIHEARMVLKTVKYLSQQGYKTENLVVLTPYLGQLALLKNQLSSQNDPYLNDMDDHDLVRAGLMTKASAKLKKNPLRLSTIDNYQGEESDIVVVSLTRSNESGDIGFLCARERLVVLMSRARNGIILFGNMHTFLKSKKGHELWKQYFDILQDREDLFDGLPVYCQQHPDRQASLAEPRDFEQHCPDGGCAQVCGAKLMCGKHTCERRCHILQDHSLTRCSHRDEQTCSRGHKVKVQCGSKISGCRQCTAEDEETRRRVMRDLAMEKAQQERQAKYAKELEEVNDKIDFLRRAMKDEEEKEEESKTLEQKQAYLQSLKDTKARTEAAQMSAKGNQPPPNASKNPRNDSQNKDCSGVGQEWEDMKRNEGVQNAALDQLMDLIGLDSVKEEFLSVKSSIDLKIRQGVSLSEERLSCSLLGNPGTGKTTVARLWATFLTTIGAIAGSAFRETTGAKLASNGVKGCEALLEEIKEDGGGVLFIDEAYQLSSGNSAGAKAVLDYLLAEVENLRGKVVFVLAGYDKEMESFFAHNPGLPSRFPITMGFEDYTDEQLLDIFQRQLHRKFRGAMRVDDGPAGLYARILARRIGRGRGKEGFGNARAVENALDKVAKRQANRLRYERKKGAKSDDMLLTKADVIGPEPSQALENCPAWTKLNDLIGLDKLKQQLRVFRDVVTTNYGRELAEEPIIDFTLNRVFVGSPGTGKTTVAKLYGQILSQLGLISNGEVVVKNPSDFVGSVLGQSESLTKGILASTVGKVLVIDEAYGLYDKSSVSDPYKTAVIDTIVAEVQSVPGDDRCVLLLGYRDQMEDMFQNVNPGLSRRFPLSSAFEFEDFDKAAMARILDLKLKQSAFKATGQAKGVAMEVLEQARNRPNFGNAGEVDILLNRAKENYQKRLSEHGGEKSALQAADFDEDFARSTSRETNVAELFRGDVGREQIIKLLEGYQTRVRELKSLDMDPKEEIPFSFLFRGPPGTGKTTTARKMGKVYYDMGFLASAAVEECSATDLIGQYVGHTGPKVQQLLDKALGKVLFIDEAYRLASGGFAQEAVDELVDCVTKPKYQGRLIIILAGYVQDINTLLHINPGMSSRFPETIDFAPLAGDHCVQLMTTLLKYKQDKIAAKGKVLDISSLEAPSEIFHQKLLVWFQKLSAQDGWASARDVTQLAKAIFRGIPLSGNQVRLNEKDVEAALHNLWLEREARMSQKKGKPEVDLSAKMADLDLQPPRADIQPHLSSQVSEVPDEMKPDYASEEGDPVERQSDQIRAGAIRDAGVSDEVWEQLEKDKAAQAEHEAEHQEMKDAYKAAQGEARAQIVRQLIEEEERRKQEAAAREKLDRNGLCPVGFQWIKQSGGYRCAGGSHWVAEEEICKL